MPRRAIAMKVALAAAVAASAAVGGASYQRPSRPLAGTRVVPPLADPALLPGVARCTSDGACTVTDARGTRAASRLSVTR